jgi:hypothetical protein
LVHLPLTFVGPKLLHEPLLMLNVVNRLADIKLGLFIILPDLYDQRLCCLHILDLPCAGVLHADHILHSFARMSAKALADVLYIVIIDAHDSLFLFPRFGVFINSDDVDVSGQWFVFGERDQLNGFIVSLLLVLFAHNCIYIIMCVW